MTKSAARILIALIVFAAPALWGQADESSITRQLQSLGAIPPPPPDPGAPRQKPVVIPEAQRPATITQLAKDIRALPAGDTKVKLADGLAHGSVQGQNGKDALQAAADTLAQALSETPQQPGKDGLPAKPYIDLAKMGRYGGIFTTLKDPQLTKAEDMLVANDADIAKADFTLKDVNGKKVQLSSLKGKIVLINFWSGPAVCRSCAREMMDLDLIFTHYESQGLVVLSILSPTPEDVFSLNHFLTAGAGYHPRVLLDDGGKVAKMFHVDSEPRTFVFDRDGKLVGESIDTCTQMQFFAMLAKGGLHP